MITVRVRVAVTARVMAEVRASVRTATSCSRVAPFLLEMFAAAGCSWRSRVKTHECLFEF